MPVPTDPFHTNSKEDARIDILCVQLSDPTNKFDPAHRDSLADDLQFAKDINGHPDPVMQMLKRILIQGVRREMITHKRLISHRAECPVGRLVTENPDGTFNYPWPKEVKGEGEEGKTEENDADSSTISYGKLSVKGPVTRFAIAVVGVVAIIWGILWRQDIAMDKRMKETLPEILKNAKIVMQNVNMNEEGIKEK